MEISSVFSNQNSVDQLIQQMMQIERRPLDQLEQRRELLNDRKGALSDLNSKVSTLYNKSTRLLDDTITNYLAAKKATSSDSAKFTATASSTAQLGNHELTVDRLATVDTRVSMQYTGTNSDFTGFLTDQVFSITLAHPTDADSTNRVSIDVTVAAADLAGTNDDALSAIAEAINTAMSDAVADDVINSTEIARASVVSEQDGVSRLVLRSNESGYTYRMDFTDSADNLLQALEVNSAVQSSGTSGGYITDIGTSSSDSLLNSKLTLDGLTFFRDSNDISDMFAGVSLRLLDTFSTPESLSVSVDTDKVKSEVKNFLDGYNGVMKTLRKYAITNPDTNTPGVLARDYAYRNMITDLRQYTTGTVTDVNNSSYSKLYNIGIEADSSGNLSLKDESKFIAALEDSSRNVTDIFQGTDGIATSLETYLDKYRKTGGKIATSKESIDNQLTFLNTHISRVEERMQTREAQLRKEFASLQTAMSMLANQQNFLSQFTYY
ncbi:MAG: flagellar filament capping protein FliD [Candidatus Marinimicrobia bacterium]|nr:flagellar filament capping protein FliD [Candidatus Neomarinimicrobiota bacterium]MCF7841113.1 flagellar filament capping protein FliD [Candidatus Neomarinimicrobiota bacterium]MCF7901797.1 flagellar filament capping protein FliD [Candidatus Neomarinimicrobiota bacterium]